MNSLISTAVAAALFTGCAALTVFFSCKYKVSISPAICVFFLFLSNAIKELLWIARSHLEASPSNIKAAMQYISVLNLFKYLSAFLLDLLVVFVLVLLRKYRNAENSSLS